MADTLEGSELAMDEKPTKDTPTVDTKTTSAFNRLPQEIIEQYV